MPRVVVDRGVEPLPFFAEYPYYLWGEVNYVLRNWQAEPPEPFHANGVAFAVEFLGRLES